LATLVVDICPDSFHKALDSKVVMGDDRLQIQPESSFKTVC